MTPSDTMLSEFVPVNIQLFVDLKHFDHFTIRHFKILLLKLVRLEKFLWR